MSPPGAAAQPPGPCALTVEVVDPAGRTLAATADLLEGAGATVVADGSCVRIEADTVVRLIVSADGFQPHATEPLALRRGAPRSLVVTLVPPFAESVTVEGRSTSLVGIAESASSGAVGMAELATRPLVRAGDILEVVPGVAMTQHSSGGHAPIILLRGYNLDHGTDFATAFEGAPMNLPSHAHAQGYTDTNFLIEDVIERIEFQKGPYSARVGNFSTAGSANIELADSVERPVVRVEGGGNGFGRMTGAASFGGATRRLLVAAEASRDDGPSEVPDAFARRKAIVRLSSTTPTLRQQVTLASYSASWFATDGYPARALANGLVTRFGTLDASDGGRTAQHLLVASRRTTTAHRLLDTGAFVRYYDLDLFSNLTFWTHSPTHGDQLWQSDRRFSSGGHLAYSRFITTRSRPMELTAGAQLRHDAARVRLRNTFERTALDKMTDAGTLLPATVYDNTITESTMASYVDARLRPLPWLRVVAGARADVFRMRVTSDRAANTGTRWAALGSPRGSVVAGPWKHTEVYANAGLGFHSNHAAGVMQRLDPITGTPTRRDGTGVVAAPPLVRTKGAEVGARTSAGSRAQSSLALWWLDSDSELIYTAEDGVTSPERPGRRVGLEWLNVVRLTRWLTTDLDAAWSSARYRTDPLGEGRVIPDAASAVVGAGLGVSTARVGANLRARYLGSRPLLSSGTRSVEGSLVLNGQLELRVSRRLRLTLQGFNLLDRRYEDTAYYYATRLRDPRTGQLEAAAVADDVTHPGQPRTLRIGLRVGL
jgi:outer membrane receptor protein involved in Fe transport